MGGGQFVSHEATIPEAHDIHLVGGQIIEQLDQGPHLMIDGIITNFGIRITKPEQVGYDQSMRPNQRFNLFRPLIHRQPDESVNQQQRGADAPHPVVDRRRFQVRKVLGQSLLGKAPLHLAFTHL